MILAELAMEAGLPDGVLNIIHGTNVRPHIFNLLKYFLLYAISYLFKSEKKKKKANQGNSNS